ncbi:MAG: ABC transporter permease subunit [Chloroflexi bacterium]|nr:ABC transporter permease subunit [Chloroflexota bacterium]
MAGLIFFKALRGHRLALALMGLGLLGLGLLIPATYETFNAAGILSQFLKEMPRGLQAFLKAEGGMVAPGAQTYVAIGYRHPIFLVINAAFVIAAAAGAVAREVEQKTIFLLLARPVARWAVLLPRWVEMVVGVALLLLAMLGGTALGVELAALQEPVSLARNALVLVNALALFLAIGGYAFLISAASSDGSRAIGAAAGVTVVFFLLDFIAGLWEPLEPLGPLSLFHYYDPVRIAATGSLRVVDLGVLLGAAVLGLAAALAVFHRRDIS